MTLTSILTLLARALVIVLPCYGTLEIVGVIIIIIGQFSVARPVVWNSIPAAVREADTVSSFKCKIKTHFFSMCFDDV